MVVIVLVGMQFVPIPLNQNTALSPDDISTVYDIPLKVGKILQNSCYDCHSNNTRYPWYSQVQPFGMLLADHIDHGKEELNFSEFAGYSNRKKKSKLKSLVHEIEEGEMPLYEYLILHNEARLSNEDKKILINWATDMLEKLER